MRNKRLVSLLLTASLALSGVPMTMATVVSASANNSASAVAVGDNVLADADAVTSGTANTVADKGKDSNGYLHVNARSGRDHGLAYVTAGTLEAGQKYRVTFDIRTAVKATKNIDLRVQSDVNGTTYYDTTTPDTTYYYWKPSNVAQDQYVGDNIITFSAGTGWTSISYDYEIGDTSKTNAVIAFYCGKGNAFTADFDIDNFKLWKNVGGTWTVIEANDFEGGTSAVSSGVFMTTVKLNTNAAPGTTEVMYINNEHYVSIAGDDSNTTVSSVKYSVDDVVLAPGVYGLDGYIRRNYRDSNTIYTYADDLSKMTVTAKLNGTDTTLAVTDFGAGWTDLSDIVFTVYEETALSELSIVTDTYKEIQLKDIELVYVEEFPAETNDDPDFTFIDVPDYKLKDQSGNYVGIDRISSYEEGNRYIRLFDRTNNWAGITFNTAHLTFDANKSYYLTFDVRTHVDHKNPGDSIIGFNSAGRKESLEFTTTGTKAYTGYVNKIGNEWINITIPYTNTGASVAQVKNMTLIGRTTWTQSNPFDFDNIGVYYIENGTRKFIYEENFQGAAVGAVPASIASRCILAPGNYDADYAIEEDMPYYAASSVSTLEYTFDEPVTLNPGVYTINAQFAYPDYDTSKLTKHPDSTNNTIIKDGNSFEVVGTAVFSDKELSSKTVLATTQWKNVNISFILDEAATLNKLTYTLTAPSDVLVRNVGILCQESETLEGLDETNYLEGATVSYTGTINNTEMETNGYLYVGERTTDKSTNFLTIQLPGKITADTKYYVGFDVKAVDAASMVIRPIYGAATREQQPGWLKGDDYGLPKEDGVIRDGSGAVVETGLMDVFTHGTNGNYIIYNENSKLKGDWDRALDNNPDGTPKYEPWKRLVTYTLSADWTYFEGTFTPTADSSTGKIIINRGADPKQIQPVAIDNFKVWTAEGTVYENNFDDGVISANGAKVTTTASVMKTYIDSTYITLTPAAGLTANIKYDVASLDLGNGAYNFKIQLATADKGTVGSGQIVFNLSDGSAKKSTTFDITDEYAEHTYYVRVSDGVTIESVEVITDVAGDLNLRNADLRYTAGNDGRMPNIGIVMVLLAKKQGGVRTENVKKEFIENGNFKSEPTIIAGDTYDAEKKNAWFQNDGEDYDYDNNGKAIEAGGKIPHAHKLTWANGYLTWSGREFNMRQIWYNTGLVLEAGTYKFSIDFKTAKTGEKSSVRVSADKLFSAGVADALAITNTWATKTVEFTVNEPTALKINIFGGPGASFVQDICIDNLKLEKLS